jgi:hypothetical protein
MPIEYEMMYLKQTVEDAISKYSEQSYAAAWFDGIESKVLDMIENEPNAASLFQDYQVAAMRELISRGYWIKYDDTIGRNVLSRINR